MNVGVLYIPYIRTSPLCHIRPQSYMYVMSWIASKRIRNILNNIAHNIFSPCVDVSTIRMCLGACLSNHIRQCRGVM